MRRAPKILAPLGVPIMTNTVTFPPQGVFRQVAGPLPLASTAAYDEFSAGAGQLPARLLSGTGIAWALERATDTSSSNDTALTVTTTGDGTAGGSGSAGAGNTYAVATAPSQNVVVLRKKPAAASTNGNHVDHVSADGDVLANTTRLGFRWEEVISGIISSGRFLVQREQAAGTLGTLRQTSNIRFEAGDIEAHEYTDDGETLQLLRNGRKRDDPLDVSAATTGVPLSRKHGVSGATASTALDYFAIIDPATDAAIMLENCPYVASLNSDGTATILIAGRYSIRAPETLGYTLFDRSSGSRVAVTGHTDATVAITTTAIDGTGWGTFTGSIALTEAQATALIGDPLELRAWRTDVKDQDDESTIFPSWTQQFYLGVNVLFTGQSLSTHASGQTASGTAEAPAGSQWINAARATNIEDRQCLIISDDTLPAHLSARVGALSGVPLTLISGGESATPTDDRLPGEAIHIADLDGITHAGGRVDFICDASGQSDNDQPLTYYTNQVSIIEDFADENRGSAPTVIIAQMNKTWSTTGSVDANYQAIREQQARLVENGVADYLAPNALDLRNADDLHLGTSTTDPHGSIRKWMNRWGQVIAFARGDVAHDGQGPELFAAVRASDTTITAYFDDDGYFDSFALVGAAFHGGCRFSVNTDASSPIWPTACSVGSRVSGGTYDGMWPVTFTFGSTLAASTKVWAGWGANPHNPDQDTDINSTDWDDETTGASILQATKTGAAEGLDKVGIRPRLRYATPSYVVAA